MRSNWFQRDWDNAVPIWIRVLGLWVLLSAIFASQLVLAGYVTVWSEAFWQEGVYWFSWCILSPAVFWSCGILLMSPRPWYTRALGLMAGAVLVSLLQPALAESINYARAAIEWWLSAAKPPAAILPNLFTQAIRLAGFNLPIYAALVLAWRMFAYSRELRERRLTAIQLESLLHQAQVQALRSQINPHFLFNTLHSIAELIHHDAALAEKLVLRLGELLRQALQSSTAQKVPLAEELEFIKGYLEIEQMRMGERLRVEWDVAPDALRESVPSLLLQPLVENAILHGLSTTSEAGRLTIRARRTSENLHVQVQDSGPGLSSKSESRRSGIGLSNTRRRLELLYGDRQRFELVNDNGLLVDIRIPIGEATRTTAATVRPA